MQHVLIEPYRSVISCFLVCGRVCMCALLQWCMLAAVPLSVFCPCFASLLVPLSQAYAIIIA